MFRPPVLKGLRRHDHNDVYCSVEDGDNAPINVVASVSFMGGAR